MRGWAVVGALLVTSFSLAAQEVSVHGSSALQGSEPVRHGLGASLSASFRLGDILADTSWARRANVRLGLRASITESRYGGKSWSLCVDFCPPNAHDVSVAARTVKATLSVFPHVSRQSRLEINGGIATYRQDQVSTAFGYSWRMSTWGFVTGAALSRRFASSPYWLHLAYTRHADPLAKPADGGMATPDHSVTAGLMLRFADWPTR